MLCGMNLSKLTRSAAVLGACTYGLLTANAALAAPPAPASSAAAATHASVSANWAGYVARRRAGAGAHFRSVSGSWREPSATCSPGSEADSAVWVGLGGYSENARGLEQVGTDADCTGSGSPVYSSWYELLPAEPVNLELAVHPGDELVASATVIGDDVTLRIRNLSTGARFSTTRHTSNLDTSSAEWIVEAPSLCVNNQTCQVLPLTNFGQVAFSAASAVVGSHTGAVIDPSWSATALELQQPASSGARGRAGARVAPTHVTAAVPSTTSTLNGAFTVSWQQQSTQLEQPGPGPLPGFSGGSP